jgi:hypothetical protein
MKLKVRIETVSGSGYRRLVDQLDNQVLFPDICTQSGKWFRDGGELFRPGRGDDTLQQKAQ